jgi:chromosome segregation ATPase
MDTRNVDDLIVMLARRARRARRKAREVEAYHRGLAREPDDKDEAIADLMSQRDEAVVAADRLETERDAARAEASRLAQELAAAQLATQDADERAQARERQFVEAMHELSKAEESIEQLKRKPPPDRDIEILRRAEEATAAQRDRALRERDEARDALAEALTRVEAREEEIRRLGNRVEAAERARELAASEVRAADRERAVVEVQANAEIRRLRREVEIRDAGIEMGVAIVRWFACDDEDRESVGRYMAVTIMHRRDEDARAAHPLNLTGGDS